jgi:hypothetical protein
VFDIFKPPLFHIRKRIPQHALIELAAVQSYSEIQLDDLSEMERQYVTAFVVAAWACNSAMAGKFQLSHRDYDFIQRCGINAIGMLKRNMESRVTGIIEGLKASRLMPD